MSVKIDTNRPTITIGEPGRPYQERLVTLSYARTNRLGRRMAPRVVTLRVWVSNMHGYVAAAVERGWLSKDVHAHDLPADSAVDAIIDRWMAANPNYVSAN